jgi:hypothetical protein
MRSGPLVPDANGKVDIWDLGADEAGPITKRRWYVVDAAMAMDTEPARFILVTPSNAHLSTLEFWGEF